MKCPSPNYSSPVEYQYYKVVTQKWKNTQGEPLSHLPSDHQPPPPSPQKKSRPIQGSGGDEKNKKKKKKEGTIFVNLPSEDSLVDEPT